MHKIRYQKKVDISFQKDLQHAHEIAPLLLVVPLENAFKHGVESLSTHAFIEIKLIQGNMIHLQGHTIPIGQTYRSKINHLLNGK